MQNQGMDSVNDIVVSVVDSLSDNDINKLSTPKTLAANGYLFTV